MAKGGAQKKPGRPPKDGATDLVKISAMIRRDQHQKWLSLGGSVWLREMLDHAGLGTGERNGWNGKGFYVRAD